MINKSNKNFVIVFVIIVSLLNFTLLLADNVDELILEAYGLLKKSSESITEAEGEILGDYLQTLIATNDSRILPLLLDVMVSRCVGGRMITKGLWKLGIPAKHAIIDSLESSTLYSRVKAANTLGKIADMDSTGSYLTEKEREFLLDFSINTLNSIREDADNKHLKGFLINTMSFLGDSSTIPLLQMIVKTDTDTSSTGIYTYRRLATRAIERIKTR